MLWVKKLNDTLKYLGSDYSIKEFDLEPCIYRKVENHEIEISGLSSPGRYNAAVYIWENEQQIIQSIQNIHSKEDLAKHLETVFQELESRPD